MTRMLLKVANAVRDRDCALRLGAEWSPELDAWPASSDDTSARASPAWSALANLGSVHERKRRRPFSLTGWEHGAVIGQ